MRNFLAFIALGLGVVAVSAAFAGEPSRHMTLYKNPECGCCEGYADYLRDSGFTVAVRPTHDLTPMSREAGIPEDFQGCHLAFVDGYVVSGHVPVATVERLLSERPDITGVTLPGMPGGSPGMSGSKRAPLTIYEIGDGAPKVYAVE